MAASQRLTVLVDGLQLRLSADAQRILVQSDREGGTDWDTRTIGETDGTWRDPVKGQVLLRPMVLHSAWNEGASGNYARSQLSEWTADAAWVQIQNETAPMGDYWFQLSATALADETAGRQIVLNSNLEANRGVYLAWYNYSDRGDFVAMECGWGTGEADATVAIRFYANGDVEVYRSGVFYSYGSIGSSMVRPDLDESAATTANSTVGVILMPWRRRELLIYGVTTGEGVSVAFDDMTEEGGEDITNASPFYVYCPFGAAMVQFAKLKFPTTGTATSKVQTFPEAPAGAASGYNGVFADLPAGTGVSMALRNKANTGAYSTSELDARLRVTLTGDGSFTPSVYAAAWEYEATTAATADEEQDVSDWVREMTLDASDTVESTTLSLEIVDPADLASSTGVDLEAHSNRPIRVYGDDGGVLFQGVTGAARAIEGLGDPTTRLRVECRDLWSLLERYTFRSPATFDAMSLTQAFSYLASLVGMTASVSDAGDDYVIGLDGAAGSRLATVVESGETAAEWFQRLHETYCATWRVWIADTVIHVKDPADLATATPLTLYETISDAAAATDAATAPFRVFRNLERGKVEPEANDVQVLGWDPRSDRPLRARLSDADSANPTTAVASRPSNWLGTLVSYGLVEPAIRSMAVAERCCRLLFDRLTVAREVGEWESDLLYSGGAWLRPGSTVTLDGPSLTYLIRSVRLTTRLESAEGPPFREARYMGDLVPSTGWPLGEYGSWEDFAMPVGFVVEV